MTDRHVAEFVAAEASAPHRHMGQDMADILNAVVEASTRKVGELDSASLDRALSSVIPRMKKVRLGDAPRMIGAFLEWAGGAAGLKDAAALAKEAVRRGEEIAREDEKKRAPVVNRAAAVNRNDPCPCGSGKKYKKCCGS